MKPAIFVLCAALLLVELLSTLTLAQITPAQDAYTNSASPTTNYGAATTVGVANTPLSIQTSYILFDLSSVPSGYSGANVAKATLKLYVNTVSAAGSFNVDYVTSSWTEKGITYNNSPTLGPTIASGVSLATSQKNSFLLVDVTSALQAWLNGTETNYGIALVANSPLNSSFDSNESTSQSHPPELDVVFSGNGTITGINTKSGSGLTGGGNTGTLNLSLLTNCAANQVLQFVSGAWTCSSAGTGTVTQVNTGTGLTGGPITGSGTISIANGGVGSAQIANGAVTNPLIASAAVKASNIAVPLSLTQSGTNTATIGGTASGSGSTGVAGAAIGSAAFAVTGITQSSGGAAGVLGQYINPSGISYPPAGVVGDSSSWVGVVGLSNGDYGVIGHAINGGYGVLGLSDTNYGVYGDSNSGVGVFGGTNNSNALVGLNTSSGTPFDGNATLLVFNNASTPQFVLYAENSNGSQYVRTDNDGNLAATAGIYGAVKQFKIDHPLDPTNKYLFHTSVESPDMMNIYNGVVALDGNGEAWVKLPDYFEALNQDFRYQLTAIGNPGPNLYIADEISGNRFRIAGGKPGAKVSWQVTGIRHDAWANAHRSAVEVEKTQAERGRYLHPEVFGLGPEHSVSYNGGLSRRKLPDINSRRLESSTNK